LRFIIFVIDSDSNSGSSDEMHEIDNFNSELSRHNQLVMAAGMAGSPRGLLIDNRGTKELVESGSLNGSEFYSGFWIIDAEDERQARELALEGSRACNRRVELRPFL
jgi:hypothetical protein